MKTKIITAPAKGSIPRVDSAAEPQAGADPLDLAWGAAAIATAIGRTTRATYHMLEAGELPAVQIGSRWVASLTKLREHFEGQVHDSR